MKKLLQFVFVGLLSIGLVACGGSNDAVKTCSLEEDGAEMIITATAKDEESDVHTINVKATMSFDSMGTTAEEFAEYEDEYLEEFESDMAYQIGGDIDSESTKVLKSEVNDDGVEIEIEIDVEKLIEETGSDGSDLSLDSFVESMEDNDMSCK